MGVEGLPSLIDIDSPPPVTGAGLLLDKVSFLLQSEVNSMFDVRFNHNIDGTINVISSPLRFKCKKSLKRFYNENKLTNNISRAKSNCFNIVNNNLFTYFYTQTVDSIYSRQDLDYIIKKFHLLINKIHRTYKDYCFDYLIIPELHLDNKSWHLHGFLSASFGLLAEKNQNRFDSIRILNELGFNSVSKINNYGACCRYILKYITKNTASNIKKGQHLYYCSKRFKAF